VKTKKIGAKEGILIEEKAHMTIPYERGKKRKKATVKNPSLKKEGLGQNRGVFCGGENSLNGGRDVKDPS